MVGGALSLVQQPLLLEASLVLLEDPNWPYQRHVCGKWLLRGLVVKRLVILSDVILVGPRFGDGGLVPSFNTSSPS